MKFKKVISLITTLAMCISMFSAFSVTSFAENDNTYSCDFTSLVKNNADTTYGTADDIYDIDDYTKAVLTYTGTYVSADGKIYLKSSKVTNASSSYSNGSYVSFTAPSDGSAIFTGSALGVYIDSTYKGYSDKGTYDMKAGETMYLGYRKGTSYLQNITFTPTETPKETVALTENPIQTSNPQSTPKADVEREVLYEENFENCTVGDKASGNSTSVDGWKSPAGTAELKSDSNQTINKYLAVTSGKSGTARSTYKGITEIKDNFVLEADIKTTNYKTNVSNFEVLEKTGSLYMNHGCYSNAKYAFKMNRPASLNKFVINNSVSDSGLSLDRYAQPTVLTKEIPDDWIHVKVIGDFTNKTATAYMTSLDGNTVYYHGRTNMSEDITSFSCLALLAPSSGVDTCIDNIKISKALDSDLSEVFHIVKINNSIDEFSQYVCDGESVVNIPDMSVYGKYFEGWSVDGQLLSSDDLNKYQITKDTTITAQISQDYIENIATVEFNSFPTDNMLTMGPDSDTYADNEISLKIVGERGTSIVTNPDSRVKDYKIDWQFDGFRTLGGKPTGESGTFPGTQVYCDSYGSVTVNSANQSSVNFKLKNTSANYYGMVTATVTYNGKTAKVSRPLVLLADTEANSDVYLPKAGYTVDYNNYENGLVGYTTSQNDILTGGWSTDGSDKSNVVLKSDNGGKYLSLSRELTGNSSYINNNVGQITSQTNFEQDVRFGIDGTVGYIGGNVIESTSVGFELSFTDSKFSLNGTEIGTGEKNKWYHIVVTADPTVKKCIAKIYNLDSNGDYNGKTPLMQSELINFNANYTTGKYYRITLSKDKSSSIDINNVIIQSAQVDTDSFKINGQDTVNIPASDSVKVPMTVSANMTDGNIAFGTAEWKINDEFADGVSVETDSADSHSADLVVSSTASAGDVSVKATLGGKSVTKTVKLIGKNDSIAFVKSPVGAQIPSSNKYEAVVKNGNAEVLTDKTVTYKLYNSDNTTEYTGSDIKIASDGTLTVSSSAKPTDIYVRAISTDSNGKTLEKSVKVNVYNLKFNFTTSAKDGYTSVTSSTEYKESRGFGIDGTCADGESYMSGQNFGFKLNLTAGEVYEIKAVYEGTIKCERVNSSLTGFEKTKNTLESDTYKTAVFGDGVLDITFSGDGKLSSLTVEKVERTANSKPAWWTIGDSTVQQNGSWAYTLNNTLSDYPKLSNVISAFYNSGQAGRQHRSYYTEGLLNNVLCGIKPGDVVSISGMGTNDTSSTKDEFKEYNNIYIDAIKAMGAKVILGSYTPTGNYGSTQDKVYDADNVLFKGMRTNSYDTAIREVYNERANDTNIIGFVDIGKIADNVMTNDVRTVYNTAIQSGKNEIEARAKAQERATALMSMWKDYNHYYTDFSNYILPQITTRVAQLVTGEKQDDIPQVINLEKPETERLKITGTSIKNGSILVDIDKGFEGVAICALYDKDGLLKQVVTETDNTAEKTLTLKMPETKDGYAVKVMNWDSLDKMTPIGKTHSIKVSDIEDLSDGDDSSEEITSSDEYIDVSELTSYDSNTYRVYNGDGTYESVKAENGKVHNTSKSEVTVVPEYKFEFTNASSSKDEYINGYVKVNANSYTEEKGYGLGNGDYHINENGCLPTGDNTIKIDVPDGFYDITVYRKGGARADVYNNGVQIINNTTSSGSQNRPSGFGVMYAPRMEVTGGQINLTIGNTSGGNERVASVEVVRVPKKYKKQVVWIAGDSESANYYPQNADGDDLDNNKVMMTGFGMQLEKFLSTTKYAVANFGQPSATVKTWYNECFESVKKLIQKDDVLIIDFGINDSVSSSNKITIDEMKQYMSEMAAMAKEKGAVPVLVSPVYNSKYQHKTYFTYSTSTKINAITEFAESIGVEWIDLNKYTQLYVNQAKTDTNDTNWAVNNYKVGDNLHLTQHSALLASSFIAAELKSMGYETTDYSYTYKDLSSLSADSDSKVIRGEESGVTRVYSVAEAEKFIKANTESLPTIEKKCDFTENTTATEGENEPVVSGSATWNETNQNIKFNANVTAPGTLSLKLNPAIGNKANVNFDLYVGALGGQTFTYEINDSEGTNLVNCSFNVYNGTGSMVIGSEEIAVDSDVTSAVSKVSGDGMSSSVTQVSNEINFATNTVTVNIGSKSFTGKLTGAETGLISDISFKSERSKKADRSIYLDNLVVREYETDSSDTDETAFPKFKSGTYTKDGSTMKYRYYLPENYDSSVSYPVVMFLHGETRKGNDNEKQLYNAQDLFDKVIEQESTNPCILVAPQCSADSNWTDLSDMIDGVVNDIQNQYSVNSEKIYIAGYSEGTEGCYKVVSDNPNKYAGIIAIAGKGDIMSAQAIAKNNTGVMIFAGSEDDMEINDSSKAIYKALVENGATNVEYKEIYGEGYNILKSAANTSGLLDWLFAKNLTDNKTENTKTVDLAIFMGQSNMAGRGEYADATECPIGAGYEFRSVSNADMLFCVSEPFGKSENNDSINDNGSNGVDRRSGDMVSSLMNSYYAQTGVPIVGVQASRGGTNIGYWNTAAQKNEAQSRLAAAKTYLEDNGYTVNHIFMVWCQGEADADKIYSGSQSAASYKSQTLNVFEYMKTVGVTDMFIVQTGHYNGDDDTDGKHDEAYVTVHDAQAELASENDNVYTVGSFFEFKENMKDNYHFHQIAYNTVGIAVGKAIAEIYNN